MEKYAISGQNPQKSTSTHCVEGIGTGTKNLGTGTHSK